MITDFIYVILALIVLAVLFILIRNPDEADLQIPFLKLLLKRSPGGNGGRGGNASATGPNATAIGGKGGRGGPGGDGGDGGDSNATGDAAVAIGGEGGEAGQANRGGSGGRGGLHAVMEDHPELYSQLQKRFGITDDMAKRVGRGGDGAPQ